MNRHLVDALTHLYPASWRRRYAAEFSAFLEERKGASAMLPTFSGRHCASTCYQKENEQ
jgi:hypothetical protein